MNRFDVLKKKTIKKVTTLSSGTVPFDDFFKEEEAFNGVQTPVKGTSFLIRSPNGYQVHIPVRYMTIQRMEGGVFLALPESVVSRLLKEIK